MKRELFFLSIGLGLGLVLNLAYLDWKPKVEAIPKVSAQLDSIFGFYIGNEYLEVLVRKNEVFFQPSEVAETEFKSFAISSTDYPKLFQQGIASSSAVMVSQDKENLILRNVQPDHGGYGAVYVLEIDPMSGEIRELPGDY